VLFARHGELAIYDYTLLVTEHRTTGGDSHYAYGTADEATVEFEYDLAGNISAMIDETYRHIKNTMPLSAK